MKQTEKDHSSSGGRLACFARLADSKDLFVGNTASIVVKLSEEKGWEKRALDYREIMLM